jgi:hypothetical protein
MRPSSGYRSHTSSTNTALVNQRQYRNSVTPEAGLMLIIARRSHNINSIKNRVRHIGEKNN